MGIDKENLKKALDLFENDDLIGSKEILRQEIENAKNDYFSRKLELENSNENSYHEDDE